MGMNFLLMIFFGLSFFNVKAQKNNQPPNIVLILADDLGYECINSYGGTSLQNPLFDTAVSNRNSI